MKQWELRDTEGWEREFSQWVKDHGFFYHELYPQRFIIGKKDPGTLKPCDLSRREFRQIQKQFEFLIAKYGLLVTGGLDYSRQLPNGTFESYAEIYIQNRVTSGDSIGRPVRHSLRKAPRKRKLQPQDQPPNT